MRSPVASGMTHLSAEPGEERTVIRRAMTEPASMQEAIDEMLLVKTEVIDIQGQLARRKGTEAYDEGYSNWKRHAVAAQRAKEARHTFLKRWITIHQRDEQQIERDKRHTWWNSLMADVITVLEAGEDAAPALTRLVAWRDAFLDEPDSPHVPEERPA